MARTGVTYEQVQQAAESILAKGENPTAEKVRGALGHTGSFTTIHKHLNQWRDDRLPTILQGQAITPPDPVSKAVHDVWEKIQQEQLAERAQFEKELNILSLNYESEMTRLETTISQMQQTLDESSAENAILLADNKYLNEKLKEIKVSLSQTEQARQILLHEKQVMQEQFEHQEICFQNTIQEVQVQSTRALLEMQEKEKQTQEQLYVDLQLAREKMEDYRTKDMALIENLKIKNAQCEKEIEKLRHTNQLNHHYQNQLEQEIQTLKQTSQLYIQQQTEKDRLLKLATQNEAQFEQTNMSLNQIFISLDSVKTQIKMLAKEQEMLITDDL